jgi:hypothetical protein
MPNLTLGRGGESRRAYREAEEKKCWDSEVKETLSWSKSETIRWTQGQIVFMAEPQTDVSRPSALPTANFLQRGTASQSLVDQNSAEYLDTIEEEWNKKVDLEVETLLDGMVDLVGLASIGDKDKFRIAQESFQAQTRAESMVCSCLLRGPTRYNAAKGSRGKLSAFNHSFYETALTPL